jgi:small subunit ribosomal protein S16
MPFCVLSSSAYLNIFKGLPMVVIRLARGGSKKRPFYNLVATDSRNRRDGRFIERVGFYNPVANENDERLRISLDRVTYWTGNGAQMSPAVQRLVKDYESKVTAAV